MARKKNWSEFVDPRTVLCQPLHSPHTAGTGAGRGRLRAGRRRGRAGMSAIIVSGAYGQKNVTYMSYPYVWRPVTPGGTAKTGGRGVAARATGRSPPRAAGVSARAYGAKGTSSTAISSAEHVAHVMGDGLFAAPASSGTPPSLNARPPYFEGRKHADRVGALGLGLCGAPVHAAVRQPPPTTCSGKDRQPTADRLRSAHNRRQMYERALGRTVSGQLPVQGSRGLEVALVRRVFCPIGLVLLLWQRLGVSQPAQVCSHSLVVCCLEPCAHRCSRRASVSDPPACACAVCS